MIKSIKYADPNQLNKKDFIWQSLSHDCLSHDVSNLQYASKKIKNDKDFIIELIKNFGGHIIEYVSPRLKDDVELIKFSFKYGGHLTYLSAEQQENKELILAYLKSYKEKNTEQAYGRIKPIVQNLSRENFFDEEILNAVVNQFSNFLQLVTFGNELINDKEFAKKAVQINPYTLQYFSRSIKNDIDVVSIACKERSHTIQFASSRIQKLLKGYDNRNEFFDKYFLQQNLNKNLQNTVVNEKKLKI